MRVEDIPQDDSKTYNGQRKVIYGTRNGRYEAATSTGWQDEAYAIEQAVAELDGLIEHARSEVAAGRRSPLYFYMYFFRHDERSLAQAAGVWRWQLRRHYLDALLFLVGGEQGEAAENVQHHMRAQHALGRQLERFQRMVLTILAITIQMPRAPVFDRQADGPIAVGFALGGHREHVANE